MLLFFIKSNTSLKKLIKNTKKYIYFPYGYRKNKIKMYDVINGCGLWEATEYTHKMNSIFA